MYGLKICKVPKNCCLSLSYVQNICILHEFLLGKKYNYNSRCLQTRVNGEICGFDFPFAPAVFTFFATIVVYFRRGPVCGMFFSFRLCRETVIINPKQREKTHVIKFRRYFLPLVCCDKVNISGF